MSFHAANPADFPHLSPCLVEQANKSLSTRNDGGELRPSYGGSCQLESHCNCGELPQPVCR